MDKPKVGEIVQYTANNPGQGWAHGMICVVKEYTEDGLILKTFSGACAPYSSWKVIKPEDVEQGLEALKFKKEVLDYYLKSK